MKQKQERLPIEAEHFMDEVRDWLILKHDLRAHLSADGRSGRIDNVMACCADFCKFMSEWCEAGHESKDWRQYFNKTPAQ